MNPTPNRSLELQSYNGNNIFNYIDADPSSRMIALERQHNPYLNTNLSSAVELSPPTGRYNCHGLVFASRRTNLDSPGQPVNIDDLLNWDFYECIVTPPQLGDIVVYRHRKTMEIDHTGFICRVEKIGKTPIIFVWSKWGALGEFEHRVKHCTYFNDCEIEYWRLRT